MPLKLQLLLDAKLLVFQYLAKFPSTHPEMIANSGIQITPDNSGIKV